MARMYTGTAGRVENCQAGVFAAYVTPDGGRALTDRELYRPEAWTQDRDRCRGAGIGDDVAFATKPELELAEYQPLFENAKRLRALLAELQDLTLEIIEAGSRQDQ